MSRVSRYAVTNFKAIGQRIELDFAPLTLLFGENSSGKSSLLQSLLLLRHYVRGGQFDAHQLGHGANVDLGGRAQYAHLGRVDEPTTWELTLQSDAIDYHAVRHLTLHPSQYLRIQISVQGSQDEESVLGSQSRERFDIGDGDGPIATLLFRGTGILSNTQFRFHDHPATRRIAATLVTAIGKDGMDPVLDLHGVRRLLNAVIGRHFSRSEFFSDSTRSTYRISHWSRGGGVPSAFMLLQAHRVSEKLRDALVALYGFTASRFEADDDDNVVSEIERFWDLMRSQNPMELDGDPVWRSFEQYWEAHGLNERVCMMPDLVNLANEGAFLDDDIAGVVEEYFTLAANLLKTASEAVEDLHHLGPLRIVPPRTGIATGAAQERSSDAVGESDWQRMIKSIDKINEWLGPEYLNAGLQLSPKRLFDERSLRTAVERSQSMIDTATDEFLDGIEAAHTAMVLRDTKRDYEVNVVDVGVGVAQVLPVLARALDRSSFFHLIEQPELHLHPRLQAELADAFIAGLKADVVWYDDVSWHEQGLWRDDESDRHVLDDDLIRIVETHSEHFILRVLRRIRETTEDRAPRRLEITASNVRVYYALPSESGTEFVHIELTPDGGFKSPWPKGFFPERLQELE